MKNQTVAFFLLSILFCLSGKSALAQDQLILKSGKEMKVNIIEESSDFVKYREIDNPSGPLYSISKDKVSSIKYKKGPRDTKNNDIKETDTQKSTVSVVQTTSQLLTVKKRHVYLNGKIQSSRNVKTIMEDYPEAVRLYESGLKKCNISNGCAASVVLVSFVTSQIANGKKEQKDVIRISVIGLGIDGALMITGIILAVNGKHNIRSSVSLYNSAITKPVSYKLDFGLQDHGVGFALKF